MTETTTQRVTIARIVTPERIDSPDAGPFLEMVRLGNESALHDAGHDYLTEEPSEVLGFWQDTADWGHAGFIAERDGRVIGASSARYSQQAGSTTLEYDLFIDPGHWGEGAEQALVSATEDEARRLGRSVVQTWTLHRPGTAGPTLAPSTGWGTIPADDRQTRHQLTHGYSLEQVERNSSFDLHGSFDLVERMLADALTVAGDEYRAVTWTSPTPKEYEESFAHVISRMSTDAPQGGLVIEEEIWDAARVQRRDARLQGQGLTVSVACVEHVPTSSLVAYNELVIGEDRTAATQQYGTLVLKEHRGRRLGVIVKCTNLLRWRDLVPESPRISTFNAEENRHMLDINETIGFVPVSYAGAWKKVLS